MYKSNILYSPEEGAKTCCDTERYNNINKKHSVAIAGICLKDSYVIKSYLEGRYQKVVLDNNFPDSASYWGEVKHAVPRG
jgi:hypothetical protein